MKNRLYIFTIINLKCISLISNKYVITILFSIIRIECILLKFLKTTIDMNCILKISDLYLRNNFKMQVVNYIIFIELDFILILCKEIDILNVNTLKI